MEKSIAIIKVIIISTVLDVADFLEEKSIGMLSNDIFCFNWGSGYENGVLVTTTGGNEPERFIDSDKNRINETFINILVRNNDIEDGLILAEQIIDLFEKNTVNGMISNKPRRDEAILSFEEETTNGHLYYFCIDLNVKYVKSN